MQEYQMQVIENKMIARDTYRMSLLAKVQDLRQFVAGCFINIKVGQGALLLRRPISLYEVDPKKARIGIIYKVVGQGTAYLAGLRPGADLNVLGPLGTGFPIQSQSQSVLLAGGGVGVPPLYELGKRLQARGVAITSVLGFQDKDSLYGLAEFESLGPVYVSTMDGSYGHKGTIMAILDQEEIDFETLYACGPLPMLKALDLKYQGQKEGYLSFEERMACGIGACYACMVETKAGLKRVCKDGPVFALGEVTYE